MIYLLGFLDLKRTSTIGEEWTKRVRWINRRISINRSISS